MIHMSLQVCFRASGRMLELSPDKQTRVELSWTIELIWANYRPKYVNRFNGPLNHVINITYI